MVGFSVVDGVSYATEWSGGNVIDLGGLPGTRTPPASTIPGRWSVNGPSGAIEWSDGAIINLLVRAKPSASTTQVRSWENGFSAVEWSGGEVIDLGVLPDGIT